MKTGYLKSKRNQQTELESGLVAIGIQGIDINGKTTLVKFNSLGGTIIVPTIDDRNDLENQTIGMQVFVEEDNQLYILTSFGWSLVGSGERSNLKSKALDLIYQGSNTFTLPNNYVVISVYENIGLKEEITYTIEGDQLTVVGTFSTGDKINVRGVIATGEFTPITPPTINEAALAGSQTSVTIQSPDAVNADDLATLGQVEDLIAGTPSGGFTYSTVEKLTNNIWYDGKNIYSKVITGSLINGVSDIDITTLDIDTAVLIRPILKKSNPLPSLNKVSISGNTPKTSSTGLGFVFNSIIVSNSGIDTLKTTLEVDSASSSSVNFTVLIILEYTKNGELPPSSEWIDDQIWIDSETWTD